MSPSSSMANTSSASLAGVLPMRGDGFVGELAARGKIGGRDAGGPIAVTAGIFIGLNFFPFCGLSSSSKTRTRSVAASLLPLLGDTVCTVSLDAFHRSSGPSNTPDSSISLIASRASDLDKDGTPPDEGTVRFVMLVRTLPNLSTFPTLPRLTLPKW